jgi:hypothetical protein
MATQKVEVNKIYRDMDNRLPKKALRRLKVVRIDYLSGTAECLVARGPRGKFTTESPRAKISTDRLAQSYRYQQWR